MAMKRDKRGLKQAAETEYDRSRYWWRLYGLDLGQAQLLEKLTSAQAPRLGRISRGTG